MRLCFVCNEYPPARHGGIGVFTQLLARELVRQGHEVRVAGVVRSGAPESAYEEDGGVRVWRIRAAAGRFGWVPARYQLCRQIAQWARNGAIDLIEVPDYEGMAALWPPLPVPVVVRIHGSVSFFAGEMGSMPFSRTYLVERAGLARADFLCSTSHYAAERTQRIFDLPGRPVEVLFNPVEMGEAAGGARCRGMVVFSGTLALKKGVHSLIRAWPLVREVCRFAQLHVFGKDGRTETGASMRAQLEAEANGSGVQFHGHVAREQVLGALAMAQAAVFPSYAEAFALAPLEAMAQGCPTVYSRRGSGPELIRDGEDGLLVDPDNPPEIATAVARILSDGELAAKLSQGGRQRVRENFSCDVLVARNEAFYQECVAGFRHR